MTSDGKFHLTSTTLIITFFLLAPCFFLAKMTHNPHFSSPTSHFLSSTWFSNCIWGGYTGEIRKLLLLDFYLWKIIHPYLVAKGFYFGLECTEDVDVVLVLFPLGKDINVGFCLLCVANRQKPVSMFVWLVEDQVYTIVIGFVLVSLMKYLGTSDIYVNRC